MLENKSILQDCPFLSPKGKLPIERNGQPYPMDVRFCTKTGATLLIEEGALRRPPQCPFLSQTTPHCFLQKGVELPVGSTNFTVPDIHYPSLVFEGENLPLYSPTRLSVAW